MIGKIKPSISEVIVVLAARPYETDGTFADFDDGMYLGGKVRFEAAAKLAARADVSKMILVGGYNTDPTRNPFLSDKTRDMADFIRTRVSKAHLHEVPSLFCTHHNFVAVCRMWELNSSWPKVVGVLSNSYHLPRALEFAQMAATEFKSARRITFVPLSAEDILGISIGNIVIGHEAEYDERLKREAQGLRQIQDGTYVDSCLNVKRDLVLPLLKHTAQALLSPEEVIRISK